MSDRTCAEMTSAECDAHLNCDECPGSRQYPRIKKLEAQLSLARAVIEAMPVCDACGVPATWTGELDDRCEKHRNDAITPKPLPYRDTLLAYLGGGR